MVKVTQRILSAAPLIGQRKACQEAKSQILYQGRQKSSFGWKMKWKVNGFKSNIRLIGWI